MVNQYDKAQLLLDKMLLQADKDHLFWMGYQYELQEFWPRQKPTWTAAAIVLAAHHLYGKKPYDHFFKITNQYR